MKVITVYQVDLWDGGERHNFGFYLSSKEELDKYQEIDIHCCAHKKEIVIFDTIEERNEYNSGLAKKRALQKLTPEERVALGFPAEI